MFRKIDDFRTAWTQAHPGVMKFLEAIPEAAAGQAVAEGHRDLRRLAWHLVETLIEMPARTGLKVPHAEAFLAHHALPMPATLAETRAAYAAASEGLLKALEAWNDASLEQTDDMYGMQWPRGLTLHILVTHQAHHLGQMSVLMRQAGLRVPGLFGPSKEEWAEFGMEAPAI